MAWAGPTGGQVVGGQAVIQSLNQETLIKQSTNKAIINWNAFSVLSNESVVFQQPNSQSIALNRVLGGSPSAILGTIKANGQVWLVNPNGILFGKSATVNATGLLATTANIANSDFLGGKYNFDIPSSNPNGDIANYGTINTSGGSTVLAGSTVDNGGTIEARLGTVAIGSGSTFAVDFDGDNLLSFAVKSQAAPGKIDNTGKLAADGGTVELTARAVGNIVNNVINTSGIVQANSVAIHNGTVILDAGQGGSVNVSGAVNAVGAAAGSTGGTVKVLGQEVALAPSASVNISGAAGGGTADIGGDLHGAGPDPNAAITSIAAGATITGDALKSGNGGHIAVWSSQSTSFNGSISAQGGPQGGNGGFVETSSAVDLSIGTGTVNTRAIKGLIGSWLLDPDYIQIVSSGGTASLTGVSSYSNDGGQTDEINASVIDSATSNVTLQAKYTINFEAPVNITTAGVGLTAESNNIIVGNSIATKGGAIVLTADAPGSNQSGGTLQLNASLTSAGGAISLGPAVIGANVTLDTVTGASNGGGAITFNGTLDDAAALTDTLTLKAGTAGNITFNARVGDGVGTSDGTPLAGITIESADVVSLNIPLPTSPNNDGFNVGQFIVEGSGSLTGTTPGAASLSAPTTYISTLNPNGGSGGSVNIVTSGNVEVGGGIVTNGTMNGTTGGNAGNVTVISQTGSVALEDWPTSLAQLPNSILGSGVTELPAADAQGVAATGANADSAGQTPGAGGNVAITAGTEIILPYGVNTAGGGAVYSGSTANGGNAGNVTLVAGGDVYAGVFPAHGYSVSGAVNGNVVGIVAAGGFAGDTSNSSDSGAGGNGGNVTITGNQLFLTHIYAEGGSTLGSTISDPATTGAGGNITLTGTATSGAAIYLYGQSEALAPGIGPDLLADAGAIDGVFEGYNGSVPEFGFSSTSVPTGYSGDITIGGTGGGALGGSSYVQLVNNSGASRYNGGAFVTLTAGGSLAKNGTDFGNIVIDGPVEGTTAGAEVLDAVSYPGSVTVAGPIGDLVALGGVHLTGNPVYLANNITTAGGAIAFSDFIPGGLGGVVLQDSVTLDSTEVGSAPQGGSITFAGTLDDSSPYTHDLTITAGSSDVSFLGRVGANEANSHDTGGTQVGVTPGTVAIESAGNINIQIPIDSPNFDGFHVGSFIVEGSGENCVGASGCTPGASGNLNADGATPSFIDTGNPSGTAGPITIDVGGKIAIGADIFAGGDASGGSGGNVTLIAGGSITVGDQLPTMSCAPTSCSVADALGQPSYYSIFAGGYAAGVDGGSGETAGNGGNVFVQGGSIILPTGVVTNGGAAIIDGATGPGGHAGTIQLTATNGDVWSGASPGNGAASGNIAGNFAAGGSAAGTPGNGAAVTISGRQLYLANVITTGGDTEESAIASGTGAGGAITLLASQLSGPAVTLYGEFDPPTGTPTQATLLARGGEAGGSSNGSLIFVQGGTIAGQGANIVIAGGGASGDWQPLAHSAYVQLVNNSANSSDKGGSTFSIGTGGGSGTTPPSILIDGAIEGTTAGAEALRIDNLINTATPTPFGSIEVTGTIGAQTPLGFVSLFGTPINLDANITTSPGVLTDVSGSNAGNLDPDSGLFDFNGAVLLQNDVTINTAGGNPFGANSDGGVSGDIVFGNVVTSSVNGAHALTLETGGSNSTASVIFCAPAYCTTPYQPEGPTNVGGTTPLTQLLIRAGGDIKLHTVTTTGSQYYVTGNDGTVALHGNLTASSFVSINSPGQDIQIIGNLDAATSPITVTAGGTPSGGEIYVSGAVSGETSGLTLNATRGLIVVGGSILTNPDGAVQGCPSGVTCDEGPTQTLSGGTVDTGSLNQTAHILLTADTTFENETGAASNPVTITPTIDSADGGLYNVTVQQRADTTGGIALSGTVGDARTLGSLTITGTSGNIALGSVGSPVGPGIDGALSVNNEPTSLGGVIATKGGAVDIAGPATLASNLIIDTTVFDSGGGAAITFGGNLTSSASASLTVNAGSQTVTANGSLGAYGSALGAVTIKGSDITLGGNIVTDNAAVSVSSTAREITLTNDVTIDTTDQQYSAGAPVTLIGNIDSDSTSSPRALTIFPGGGFVTLDGALGASAPLASFEVLTAGNILAYGNITTAGGSVTIGGAQIGGTNDPGPTITGDLLLANGLTINTTGNSQSAGASISIADTIDDAVSAGAAGLSLYAGTSGAITLGGDIGGAVPLGQFYANGQSIALNAGTVITSDGSVEFDGPVTFSQNLLVDTTAGGTSPNGASISFDSTVDDSAAGQHSLSAAAGEGSIEFLGDVGDQSAPQSLSLTTTGQIVLNGNIATVGAITANGSSFVIGTSGAPVAFTTSGGAVDLISTDQVIYLGNDLTVDTTDGGKAAGADIEFGGNISNYYATPTLVATAGVGAVTFGGYVDEVSGLTASGSAVSLGGPLYSSGAVSLTGTGGISLGGSIYSGGPIALTGPIGLQSDVTIDSEYFGTGANITLDGTIDGTSAGAQSLSLQAGSGAIVLSGDIGGIEPLGQFGASGQSIAVHANNVITSDGVVEFGAPVTFFTGNLLVDTTAGGTSPDGGAAITFDSTIDDTSTGQHSLTATAGRGAIDLEGDVGDRAPLQSLSLTSAGGITLDGSITTVGAITANGGYLSIGDASPVAFTTAGGAVDLIVAAGQLIYLNNSLTVDTTNGGKVAGANIDFGGGTNSGSTSTLTATAGTGTVTFGGYISEVNSLTASGSAINLGGSVYSAGPITLTGPITLLSDVSLYSTYGQSPANIAVNGTVDGTTAGAQSLQLDAGSGTVTLGGDIGATVPLGQFDADGQSVALHANNVVTSDGRVEFAGPVSFFTGNLLVDTTAGGTSPNGGAGIIFNSTIDDTSAGRHSLTATAGSGQIALDGNVGGQAPLQSLSLTTTGNITLDGSITTVGAISANGGYFNLGSGIPLAFTTSGGAVDLTAATGQLIYLGGNLTVDTTNGGASSGANIDFGGNINSSNTSSLTATAGTGSVTFGGYVSEVGSLTASGGAIDLDGSVYSAGPITLTGPIALLTDVSLYSTYGQSPADIALNGTVDGTSAGAQSLSLYAGSGTITLGGAVGSTVPLGGLTASGDTINLGNVTTFNGSTTFDPSLSSVSLTAATQINLAGNIVTSDSSVELDGPTILAQNVTIDTTDGGKSTFGGANIIFDAATTVDAESTAVRAGPLEGAFVAASEASGTPSTLTLDAGKGQITTGNALGSLAPLGAISMTATGSNDGATFGIVLGGNITTAGGRVDLFGPAALAASIVIDTTGNGITGGAAINLHNSVDGYYSDGLESLTLNAGTSGTILVGAGGIGQVYPIGALTANAAEIDLEGSVATYNGAITLNGPIDLDTSVALNSFVDSNVGANIALNGAVDGVTAGSETLTLNAGGGDISAPDSVKVGGFILESGSWSQVGTTLPTFQASNFELTGGTFLRALGGDGSSGNPYQITDIYGLQGVGTLLSADFVLANAIDAAGAADWNQGAGFAPIGNGTTAYSGTFDAKGFAISGLTINSPLTQVGLFGDNAGKLDNFVLTNVNVTGTGDGAYIGALAGVNTGAISGASATGSVTGGATVCCDDAFIGGLVGYNNGGSISGSSANVATGDNANYYDSAIGGLVGLNDGNGSITGGSAVGNVTGNGTGNDYYDYYYNGIGGLVGTLNSGTISGSYATGSVMTTGGGNDTYGSGAGGLVGIMSGGTIALSYATGPVSTASTVSYGNSLGGLVGWMSGGTITRSYASGSVTDNSTDSSSYTEAGGLVGYFDGTISQSFATGPVAENGSVDTVYLGGLVGLQYGAISDSYATGAVSSSKTTTYAYIGGLVGYLDDGSIATSYAVGPVQCASTSCSQGGLVGAGSGTIDALSFWDMQTTGEPTSAGGQGLTTGQAQSASYLEAMNGGSGWSFSGSSPWRINDGASYPYLLWHPATIQEIVSGTAPVGATVDLLVDGTADGQTVANGSGNYSFILSANTLGDVLVYIPGGAADAVSTLTAKGADGLALVGNTVDLVGNRSSIATSDLATAKGGATSSDILYTVSGTTILLNSGIGLTIAGRTANVVIDDAVVTSGAAGTIGITGPSIALNANMTSSGGAIMLSAPTILGANAAIDTTASGATPGGAAITFNGTLDDTTPFAHTLTITAGGGDVTFASRVGNNSANLGVDPGAVTITSAGDVDLTMPLGSGGNGFSAGSLSVIASGSFNVTQGYISTYNPNGSGGAVSLNVGGAVDIAGNINTGAGASGGNGGNVTIAAGGAVTIFGCCTLSQFGTTGTGDEQIANASGIYTAGYNASVSATSAGNGGSVSITAASINLPLGAATNGGSDTVANSTGNGGSAGSIHLTATTGNVTVGDAPDNGVLTGLYAVGGNSMGGAGGAGNSVKVTAGDQISLSRVLTVGGSTESTANPGGAGGNISLTANATSGAAVQLYGEADSAQMTPSHLDTLDSRAGYNGVTFPTNGSPFFTGGAVAGAGGNIAIGSSSGALKGSSYVQVTDDSAAANYEGGSTVFLFTQGTNHPSITVAGSIEGTNAGAEALRIGDLFGPIAVEGRIGDQIALGYVSLDGAPTTLGGNITTVPGSLMLDGSPASYSGKVYVNGPLSLASDVTIATNGADVTFGNVYAAPVDGAHALTVEAAGSDGSGAVTFDSGSTVGATTPLTGLSVTGGNVTLQAVTTSGDVTVTGSAISLGGNITTAGSIGESTTGAVTITGPVTLASPVTVDTTDGGTTTGSNIVFNGTIDDTSTGNQWLILKANDTPQVDLDNAGNCCGNLPGEAQPSTDGGSITLAGNLGGNVALGEVELTGSQVALGGNITTSGGRINVFVGNPNVATAPGLVLTSNGVTTLSTGSGSVNLFYANNIDGTVSGQQGLTVDTTATTVLPPAVGANVPLGALTIPGPMEVHGSITTAGGAIDFGSGGTVFLTSTLDTTANGAVSAGAGITIGGPLASGNPIVNVTLNGGTGGIVTLGGDVGGGNPFASVNVIAATVDLGGNITTNGDGISLTGTVALTGTDTIRTLDTTGAGQVAAGGNISLGGTVDTQSGQSLNLNGGTGGTVTVGGTVGGNSSNGFGAVTMSGAHIDLDGNIETAGQPVTIDGQVAFATAVTIDTTADNHPAGADITLNPTPGEAITQGPVVLVDPIVTLNGGTDGTVDGTIDLGQNYYLHLGAGSSTLTGTVNGANGDAAAQYVTLINNCAHCSFNGVQDSTQTGNNGGGGNSGGNGNGTNGNTPEGQDQAGAAGSMPQSNPTTTNANSANQFGNQPTPTPTPTQEAVVVSQSTSQTPTSYQSNDAEAPTTVPGIDSGASLFVAISPTAPTDLTVNQSATDQLVVAYANPPPVKPAANAEPQRPQVVHSVAAYLNQMVTTTVPSAGIPGISFGYSLSGNSALW